MAPDRTAFTSADYRRVQAAPTQPVQSAGVLLARSLTVALMFALLSMPPALQRWCGGDTGPYVVVTIALAAIAIALALSWPAVRHAQALDASPTTPRRPWAASLVTVV